TPHRRCIRGRSPRATSRPGTGTSRRRSRRRSRRGPDRGRPSRRRSRGTRPCSASSRCTWRGRCRPEPSGKGRSRAPIRVVPKSTRPGSRGPSERTERAPGTRLRRYGSRPPRADPCPRDDSEEGGQADAVYYKSDRIPNFYPWARRVIDKGGAYVCTCAAELLRENRANGVACAQRTQTHDETVEEWERMLANAYGPGEAVLRLRTDIADPDPAFRDRILLRISDIDHPRVGTKYRIWPMLEFSWAVDDIELGITHVIRGKDLVIEDRMQRFISDLLGITGPPFLHWGILRVREAKVSKSKSYREVKSGLFDGWADPRTWSLRSLDRRGISTEALRAFILSFGMSLSD